MAIFLDDLRKIWATDKLDAIEWIFGLIIFCLKAALPSEWILWAVGRWFDRYVVMEFYVICTTILLAGILFWSDCERLSLVVFASYFLTGPIITMTNIVFLTKVFGPIKSNERTLLLFIFNVAQVVLTFAIWYRFMVGKEVGQAVFDAMLVLGTIGYPKGAELAVAFQIATDFFLLAIFLAFILGNLGRRDRPRS